MTCSSLFRSLMAAALVVSVTPRERRETADGYTQVKGFNFGIAERNMIGAAAGLATTGHIAVDQITSRTDETFGVLNGCLLAQTAIDTAQFGGGHSTAATASLFLRTSF